MCTNLRNKDFWNRLGQGQGLVTIFWLCPKATISQSLLTLSNEWSNTEIIATEAFPNSPAKNFLDITSFLFFAFSCGFSHVQDAAKDALLHWEHPFKARWFDDCPIVTYPDMITSYRKKKTNSLLSFNRHDFFDKLTPALFPKIISFFDFVKNVSYSWSLFSEPR